MQTMQLLTLVNILLLLVATVIAAQSNEADNINALQLTPFHPISRAEYEAILGLTNGQQTISEARLIASGIAALKGLVTVLKAGLSGTFLASWVGALPTSTTTFSDGYPLCVINAGKEPVAKQNGKQYYDPNDPYQQNYEQQSAEDQPYSPYSEQQQTVSPSPLVNCIVVVKKKPEGEEEPAESLKPQPYNSWQQHRYQQQPDDPWYGYPSAAYYGFPPPPPPSSTYHHYRSSPMYHSYPSNNNGYQRFSAYQNYPEYATFPLYARQQPPFQVSDQQQPQPLTELPETTTKAPTSPPITTRKHSTKRPHMHSLKPIKHLSQKRKRPNVAVQYDTDNSSSAEADDESAHAVQMQSSQHNKPNIQIHKIDPPYHAEDDDQVDSTETITSHHSKAKIKRPTAASHYHSKQKKHGHRHHSAEHANQADQLDSAETVSRPQYTGHKNQKHKTPTAEQNSYTEDSVDAADSAETAVYTKYPKQDNQQHKHRKPAPSTYADNEDSTSYNDNEDRPNAEETASYPYHTKYPSNSESSSNHNKHHSKPTGRPANSSPRPHKPNKRKNIKNAAIEPEGLQSNEQISSPQPTSATNNSKRDKATKYSHAAANYAEMSEYPHDSYQPAPYPQLNYQSTYPKVSYTQAQSNPAPVYVKKTKIPSTAAPSTNTEAVEFGIDSSESENSAEFIKVRQTDYDE